MKTIREIKDFCQTHFGFRPRGNTIACKAKWQRVLAPIKPNGDPTRIEFSHSFPSDFRRLCIRTVYPATPSLHTQDSAGNVDRYSITMLPAEWEDVIATYELQKQCTGAAVTDFLTKA